MEQVVIREASGSLLTAHVDALVNTVNTVGVMGKGIALQFKRAYPAMFRAYQHAAKADEVEIGRMFVWETGALEGPRFVINFPTKQHWRAGSRLEYIEAGLVDLARVIRERGIRSIAVPPLGCGNGGLDWADVRPLIERHLGGAAAQVLVYPPTGAPRAAAMVERRPEPRMTEGRRALLAVMRGYQELTLEAPSVVEVQKLMYFLQDAGESLRLAYVKGRYGPYADNLRHVLFELEGHLIIGFGDGSARVDETEPLVLLDDAWRTPLPAADSATMRRVERVLRLAEGFASPYGLELLASTHWTAVNEADSPTESERIVEVVRTWTPRKARLFTREHILHALAALQSQGWLSRPMIAAHS